MNSEQERQAREAFEAWYVVNAFDYAANPIGSRECGLQRAAYLAATERMAGAVAEKDAEIARLREESESWEETYRDTKRIVDEELSPRIAELERYGYVIAMRLMQSEVRLDDTERAGLDAFITKANIRAALKETP